MLLRLSVVCVALCHSMAIAAAQTTTKAAPADQPAAASKEQPATPVAAPADATSAISNDTFTFVAFGDTPYRVPQDFPKFDRLIERISAAKPAFAIHVGDIKSSSEPCTDEYYKTILTRFNKLDGALVYTPGDNEWTDCHRERAGRFNPRERLETVRKTFYANPTLSLGAKPIAVVSQSTTSEPFARYVENVRFWRNGVLFVTVHVVGSNNGFETTEPEAAYEYFDRNRANNTWLDDSFKLARDKGAAAVVVAMHANLYDIKQRSAFMPAASGLTDTVKALERGTKTFGKPVLVVHGDEHEFEVIGLQGTDYKRIPNAWRLQVMGDTYVHAVSVTVDPKSPGVFSYAPLIVPENGPQ